MRILHVTPRYFPNIGGTEIVAQKISETLVAKGFQAIVYSVDLNNNLPKEQIINGVLVKRFRPILSDPYYIPEPKFIRAIRRENADIIHVHNIHIPLTLLTVLLKRGKQKILLQPHYHRFGQTVFRHSLFKVYKYLLNNIIFSCADVIIANSIYEKRILQEDFSKCKNVILLPEGIDTEELKNVKQDSEEPKRVLYIGALKRYKNVDKIIEGFAMAVKETKEKMRLVIVGQGPEWEFLNDLARRLGIVGCIEWKHGLPRQQLLQEYAKSSVFIMLSPLESFSRVVYEALLIGIPVVVLNFGATKYLVDAGFAEGVNSLKPSEIADSLRRALQGKYLKISRNVKSFLDWKEYSRRIINIYQELLQDDDINHMNAE